jgi:protein gp37
MSATTKIEWTDRTWNPVTGCTKVSPGCDNCYAETFAERWRGTPGHPYEQGFDVRLRPERLDQPLHWRKPSRVFVNSMSDLFHDAVPDEFIVAVFARMWWSPQHTFQILSKRHGRMRSLVPRIEERLRNMEHDLALVDAPTPLHWPLPNVWLGCSVENQQWADIRIPALLDTPAAVRFLSCEPLLGPVDLRLPVDHSAHERDYTDGMPWPQCLDCSTDTVTVNWTVPEGPRIDWVICGGESGPRARPMHPDWARSLRGQCEAAGTAFFLKQHGEWQPLGPLYGDLEDTDEGHLEAVHLDVIEGKRVIQLESDGYIAEGHQPADSRTWLMARVGKKAAGRELDGRTHDDFPEPPRSDFRASVEARLTEDLDAFSRRMSATTDTSRRT